jgi:SRSO17 transposase
MPTRPPHPTVPSTPLSGVPAPQVELVAALASAAEEVPAVAQRLAPRFARSEARRHAQAYLWGLLSPVERKNGWQLAEVAGDRTPYAIQHLLGRADWDPDAVREDLRAYVVEHLSDPHAVLVLDETAVVKKGTASAGVDKQYAGVVGKLENAQVGVFLAYASPAGVAFLDRALYLPEAWTTDPARCQAAGIPDDVLFATKPALARQLLERARAARVPATWVTADSIYGDDRRLRMWLEAHEQAYVLAVSGKEYVNVAATWTQRRVSTLLAELPAQGWERLSAGDGEKGPRWYDWYWLPLVPPLQEPFERWFLVRRSISDPTDLQAYVVFAPVGTAPEVLVQVAGRRWTIEAAFEAAKGEVGLDHYEVRSWTGWYRHMTLALFAQAVLTVVRTRLAQQLAPRLAPRPTGPPAAPTAATAKGGQVQQAVTSLAPPASPTQRPTGSLATFRHQRRDQEQAGRWPRRRPPPPSAPSRS